MSSMRWSVPVWVVAFLSLSLPPPSSSCLSAPTPVSCCCLFALGCTASGLRCRHPWGSSVRWGRSPRVSMSQQREFSFPSIILLPFCMAHVGVLLLCIRTYTQCRNGSTRTYSHVHTHIYYTHVHTHIYYIHVKFFFRHTFTHVKWYLFVVNWTLII